MGIHSGLENISVIIYIKIYTLGTALKTLSSQFPVFRSAYTSCLYHSLPWDLPSLICFQLQEDAHAAPPQNGLLPSALSFSLKGQVMKYLMASTPDEERVSLL